jgi:dienelactone hydrolase
MRKLIVLLLPAVLICQSAAPLRLALAQGVKPFPELARMFDYDRNAPLDLKENGVEDRDGVKVHDITYASPKGGRVTAYLVVPPGKGRHAGLIFMHWGFGYRSSFLAEALLLARTGAVSLMIDAPYNRPAPWRHEFDNSKPEVNRDVYVQMVIDLRRGVDLLTSRRDVDAGRLGFVGLSLGAHMGGILSGVEKRIKAFVLMGGLPTITERLRRNNADGKLNHDIEVLSPIDPIHYVGHAAPSALFFQFARHDRFITEQQAIQYEEAASRPKIIKWYDTGHELNELESLRDRAEWLRQKIGLSPLAPALRRKLG